MALTLIQKLQTLQQATDFALTQLRLSRDYIQSMQMYNRERLGLFLDSRIEDALKALDEAVAQLECSRCPHAATSVRDDGPMCDRCAEDYTVCSGCGKDVRAAVAYEDDGKDYHVECAPYEPYDPTEPQR